MPITYAHVFLNFEILSSNGGLVSAFGYTILVLVPGFFYEKKSFFTPGHVLVLGTDSKSFHTSLVLESGARLIFAWHILSGINQCCAILLFFLTRIWGLGFDSFNETWRVFGRWV